jgi:uncharacterized OB-fold protein
VTATETKAPARPKPLPPIFKVNAGFWEGSKVGELRLDHCKDCDKIWFPPSNSCPNCLSTNIDWKAVSGRGKVWSWIWMHQRYGWAFDTEVPYLLVQVNLEEGPSFVSTLVGVAKEDLRFDMPVKVTWQERNENQSVPVFEPA